MYRAFLLFIIHILNIMGNGSSFATPFEESKVEETEKEIYFAKIDEADLKKAFSNLRNRCSSTWKSKFEKRATELHKNCMTLRHSKTVELIDPAAEHEQQAHESNEPSNTSKPSALRLMKEPKLWEMEDEKNGEEFFEILRHFTRFTPYEGRPFVRA